MIKFRCCDCGKKIGVPDEYIGKHVKCPGCSQPIRVPQPDYEPAAESVESDSGASGPGQRGLEEDFSSENLLAQAVASDIENPSSAEEEFDEEQQEQAWPCPRCNSRMTKPGHCGICGYSASIPLADESSRRTRRKTIPLEAISGLAGFPLAVITGFGMAILGGMIWGGIAKYTECEFGFVAWILGILVGGIMGFCDKNRSTGLGIIACLFAVISILCGKYYIAKWVVMPEMESFLDKMTSEFSSEETVRKTVRDEQAMYGLCCYHLGQKQGWDDEFRETLLMVHQFSSEIPAEQKEQFQHADAKVKTFMAGLSPEEKRELVRNHFAEIINEVRSEVTNEVGMKEAFKASFGFLDILWIILAVSSAYKVATYEFF